MPTNILAAAAALTDHELLRRVEHLASHERETSAELIAHLAELDARRIYLAEGYGSLFAYCTGALQLSEDAAYSRILAARLARKFPVILELLVKGSLNLTTVRLLAAHLTPDNHREVLAEATGKGKRQIEALVARLSPEPDVPASVRKLPTPAQPPAAPAEQPAAVASPPSEAVAQGTCSPLPLAVFAAPARRPIVAPVAPERYRMQFTVGRDTYDRLQRAQDLLCREIPDGDPGAIFDRALTLLLKEVERKKLAATTSRPHPGGGIASRSRHVPAAVRRAVWRRDVGRCAYVSRDGRRCTEHKYLEFHHVDPYSSGGKASFENISLRCRRHNVHEAELVFGRFGPSVARERPEPYTGHSESRYVWLPVPEQARRPLCGQPSAVIGGGIEPDRLVIRRRRRACDGRLPRQRDQSGRPDQDVESAREVK